MDIPYIKRLFVKTLLIGSAPYIVDWYKLYGEKFLEKGWDLSAINNAWKIDPDNLKIWIHSNDFEHFGERPSAIKSKELEKKLQEICTGDPDFKPYTYVKKGSGTMLLNSLCLLLNSAINRKRRIIVAIAGSDCIYTGWNDHFYGIGTADPVRFGKKWLVGELERIKRYYEQEDCEIINIGGQSETLLPFKQLKPEQVL